MVTRNRDAARPSSAGRLVGLDGIRGFAVLLVLGSHAHFTYFNAGGVQGVTIFFVLSGFLITGLLLKEFDQRGRIDLAAFWGRRALRLVPGLVAFIVGTLALAFLVGGIDMRVMARDQALPSLLYYSNMIRLPHLGPFAHTWSLGVEEQFYLVWPLVLVPVLALTRHRRTARNLAVGSIVVVWALLSIWMRIRFGSAPHVKNFANVHRYPHTTTFSMALGAALAVVHHVGFRWSHRWISPLMGVVTVIALFVLPRRLGVARSSWLYGPIWVSVLTLVLIVAVWGTAWTPFSLRPLRWFGTISYSLYLWHFAIFWFVVRQHPKVRLEERTKDFVIAFAISVAIAALSWYQLERPILNRFRPRLERSRLQPVEPVATLPSPSPSPSVVDGDRPVEPVAPSAADAGDSTVAAGSS